MSPYKVRKRGSKWEVYNTKSGKKRGTHATKKKAEAQKRVLYANVPDTKKRRRKR